MGYCNKQGCMTASVAGLPHTTTRLWYQFKHGLQVWAIVTGLPHTTTHRWVCPATLTVIQPCLLQLWWIASMGYESKVSDQFLETPSTALCKPRVPQAQRHYFYLYILWYTVYRLFTITSEINSLFGHKTKIIIYSWRPLRTEFKVIN